MNILLAVLSVTLTLASATKEDDFLDNLNLVPPPPPETLEAIEKCGEGDQEGKFICVPYYNCDPFTNTTIEYPTVDGSNIIHPLSSRYNLMYPQCEHYLEVCCRVSNTTINPAGQTPTIKLEFQSKCGIRNGGKEFPWALEILKTNNHGRVICAASLLTPVIALTAAHCVIDLKPSEIKIRTGKKMSYQERQVAEIIIHGHHMRSTLYNDVALLILNSSLTKTGNIGTVCLPYDDRDFETKNCLVTGWDKNNSSRLSLVPRSDCQKALRTTSLGDEFILDHSFLCTGGQSGTNACTANGGGPLVCPDSKNLNRYLQVGVVSWSVECGKPGVPGVYANVTSFRNWIDYKVQKLGYNLDPYTL